MTLSWEEAASLLYRCCSCNKAPTMPEPELHINDLINVNYSKCLELMEIALFKW